MAVIDAGHLRQSGLDDDRALGWGGDGGAGHRHRATGAGLLASDGVGLADLVHPVALLHRMMESVARCWHHGWQ